MPYLSIRNLSVRYGPLEAVRSLNLEVERGDVCCLIGPSGCGKSTLLKTLCGILQPSEGQILLNDQALDPVRHTIGYIPQYYGLLHWLSVRDNIFLGKTIRRLPASPDDEAILRRLELLDLLPRYPQELSGGQQQRVALARAWMIRPQILLMDEPFSALDPATADRSIDLFLQLHHSQALTTLLVTHSLQEATRIGKTIALLSDRPAQVRDVLPQTDFKRLC
jgi:NitT/TauT family transport system ATP-binding protein